MPGRWPRIAGVSLLVACSAIPQDLAPEVLLLSRIKRHLRVELERIPNYTCLETISRFRNDPKSLVQLHKGLARIDTVRLEIVYTDHYEWYGSPGARDLSVEDPMALVGGGMIGNGAFALSLHNAVEGGIFTYRGEKMLDGRPAVKYDFRTPGLLKPLTITVPGGEGTVGEEGSIWVDPQSLDILRLESRAAEIPAFLPVQESGTTVDYARTRIGDSIALLAQQADSHMLEDSGEETFNRMEFTHCRSFTATSAIKFQTTAPEPTASAPPVRLAPAHAVPPFLEVTVLLTTPISDRDTVGTLIEGKISGTVMHKGKVAVADGSVVHGRIRRLEHYGDRGVYAVGLEFTEVELHGESLPFYAELLRLDKDPRIERELTRRIPVRGDGSVQTTVQTVILPELPGVAAFFLKAPTFTLPNGFRMVWRTRGQIH